MLDALIERIRAAYENDSPLIIQGGGSKGFYGNADEGEVLSTRGLTGIVDYQSKELVLTARAGTPLADIEALLAEHDQMLAFEPPHFSPSPQPFPSRGEGARDALRAPKPIDATLGGSIAAGLSGPRRPYAGAARDFVLGVRIIDGRGQPLRFGGQVIKNVAGYDVSRLMVGALGTLGLITEVSLKVLPRPAEELALQFELDEATAIVKMNEWAGQPLPLSATSWHAGVLSVRLSGAAPAVRAAHTKLGGEVLKDGTAFWQRLRDHATPFFDRQPLWRLAVKSTTPPLGLGEAQWIEWGGALRWLASEHPAGMLRAAARAAGGHATLFRGEVSSPHSFPRAGAGAGANVMPDAINDGVFTPLPPAMRAVHRALKLRFDPRGILNRGRLYPDF
ncbi:MAG: glycolate oxidase subunit GlcE [Thiobacillus sp. 65-29]|jgi:glycolate oxidase FAD binding subunit|nr:MAG: glycolate oxidase subunit GlcE [Thiobacillus sp. 65-29]